MSEAWVYFFLILSISLAIYSVAAKLLRFLAKSYLAEYVNQLFEKLQQSSVETMEAAYLTENQEEVRKALRDWAYTKLEIISLPKTTYQQQILNIEYVIHAQLPPNKRQVELLIRALSAAKSPSAQHRYKLQAKIAGYLYDVLQHLQGEGPISKPLNGNGAHKTVTSAREQESRLIRWSQAVSIWFTVIVMGAFLAFAKLLDAISMPLLLIILALMMIGLAISLMLILNGQARVVLTRSWLLAFGIILAYMAVYSQLVHTGSETGEISGPNYSLKIVYPKWLIANTWNDPDPCLPIVVSVDGDTPIPFDMALSQSPDVIVVREQECKLAPSPVTKVEIHSGQTGLAVWHLLPYQNPFSMPTEVKLIPEYDTATYAPAIEPQPPFVMRVEHPLWKYARDIVLAYMGAATVLQAIILWFWKSTTTA